MAERVAVALVAAVADNGVIGAAGAMPWRLATDMKRFRALTMGKPVIMGRKTFASIGKPLAGRTNIVVTRQGDFAADGVTIAACLDAALADPATMRVPVDRADVDAAIARTGALIDDLVRRKPSRYRRRHPAD